jgi:nucleotidyltransferase-like protein
LYHPLPIPAMTTADRLYPDPARPATLATALCAWFANLPYVQRVAQFGSLVQGTADRWSDLDMLVVTARRRDCRDALAALHEHKPFLYHAPVRKSEKHPGANALSITFAGESPFNCLDLNFIALPDYAAPNSVDWLKPVRDCYVAPIGGFAAEAGDDYAVDELDELEMAIDGACFWTRRAAKGLLRGKSGRDLLARRHEELVAALRGTPEDCAMAGGNICRAGRVWLAIAAVLLRLP